MGHWHPNFVRAQEPDLVRRWADLEGKSTTMRDDLYRQYARHRTAGGNTRQFIGILGELIVTALDAWWLIDSR